MNSPMGKEFRWETQYKQGLGKLSLETRREHTENWRDRFLFWRQLNPDYIITCSCQERIKEGMKIMRGLEPCALEGWGVLCQPSCVVTEVQPALQQESWEMCTQYPWRSTHLRQPILRKACEVFRSEETLFVPSATCQVRKKKKKTNPWDIGWAVLTDE